MMLLAVEAPSRSNDNGGASGTVELSIVMPSLNEAETLAVCEQKARGFLERNEVIVAENGSTDGSQVIATRNGAPGSRNLRLCRERRGQSWIWTSRGSHGTAGGRGWPKHDCCRYSAEVLGLHDRHSADRPAGLMFSRNSDKGSATARATVGQA